MWALFWLASGVGLAFAVRLHAQQIDYAVLQFPAAMSGAPGQATSIVYGRVYSAGLTDQNSSPAPGISAELGIGAHATDPASDPSWRWVDAMPNPGWDFSQNDDEYQANIIAHASGTYDYAYRFAYAAGSWSYADLDGSTNGYSSAQAGQLTISGDTIYVDNFEG